MKTKNILTMVIIVLFSFLGTNHVNAQTHKKAASNCIMYDDYVKAASKTKNAVSCVDCYCKICGDKKQKEKEAKLKAAEAANKQKNTTPQKKTTATTTTKAKSDEAILVAPKPKTNKTTAIVLSADDKKIIEIIKNLKERDSFYMMYCVNKDASTYCVICPDFAIGGKIVFKPANAGYDPDNNSAIILRDNFTIKSKFPYTFYEGGLTSSTETFSEAFKYAGLFFVSFEDKATNTYWYDLVDIQGNCVFNNKEITLITYSDKDKTFHIRRERDKGYTEQYDPITKEITPIN